MGFFSPGLGFASTAGAFITGAARQGNAMLDEQRKQDRQDDIMNDVWANKFDDNVKRYDAVKKQQQEETKVWSMFKDAAGGNEQAADMGMTAWRSKPGDFQSVVENLQKMRDQGAKAPDNYKSPFAEGQQSAVKSSYDAVDRTYQRLNPRNRGMVQMPDAPDASGSQDYSGGGNQQQMSPTQISSPMAPSSVTTPPPAMSSPSAPQAPPIGGQPSSMNPATPMGGDNQADPSSQGADNSQQAPTQASATTNIQTAQVQPQAPHFFPNAGKGQMTAAQQAAIAETKRRNDLAAQEFEWKKGQKPPNASEAADMATRQKASDHYIFDPKTGLDIRMQNLENLNRQAYDLQSLQGIINRGFKSNAVQDIYDTFNGFTTAVLGADLSTLGISNTYADATELKKAISNSVIDRLTTLHFGRITNYEAQTVKDGLINGTNSPNTNVKIGLIMQKVISNQYKHTSEEYNTVWGQDAKGSMIERTEKARQSILKNAQTNSPDKPAWEQVDGNSKNANKQFEAMPMGKWFEDTATGTMYMKTQTGIKKAGDNVNG